MDSIREQLDSNDITHVRAAGWQAMEGKDYYALQIALLRRELEKASQEVRRNQSAENSRHGPQALQEQMRRHRAESRAEIARDLLARLPAVTSHVLERANHLEEQMRQQEQRHRAELEATERRMRSLEMQLSVQRDSGRRAREENEALRRIVTDVSRYGIDRIEAAIDHLESQDAA